MKIKDSSKIINPFITTGKIPAKYFCDRREESKRLIREVTNGNNLVLISSRRMGKTGLILHCYDNPEIHGKYETFYIDILQTSSLKEFIYLFGREIFNKLAPSGLRRLKQFAAALHSIAGSFGFDPITGMPTFNLQLGDIVNPELTLEEIFKFISESEDRCLIAIDEFQQICNYNEKNVEALLRTHIQHLGNANFIFAGSEAHILRQMFTESARPFYNNASIMELNPIELSEYTEFAKTLFEEAGKGISSESIRFVYQIMEGNTFYLQKTFNTVFSKTSSGEICSIYMVEESLAEILGSFETLYKEILSGINEPQKQLLIAIASSGIARGITSSQFIKKYALASASSVQAAAKRLLESGMISRTGSEYKIQDPMLRQWLLLTYTAQKSLLTFV